MFQIIVAEFKHETNTFSSQRTDFAAYRRSLYAVGDDLVSILTGTATEVGGMLDVLEGQPDVSLIPVVAANAIPAGPVAADVFEDIRGKLVDAIRVHGPIDGILLCLHGAMVTENSEDGEGDLLEAVRQAAGDGVWIMATLDLHANITQKMSCCADVLINYDYYPHADMVDRGREVAQIMLRTLRGEIRPAMVCKSIPLILPPLSTNEAILRPYVDQMHAYEAADGVLTVSIAHGFLCADIHELGMTVVAVTDQDPERAGEIADELAAKLWQDRQRLKPENMTVDEALDEAERSAEGPVILADLTDNPGGGSPGDGTHILRAMISRKMKNAAVALVCDPESVAACVQAGVGQTVRLLLGGHIYPDLLGQPIECDAYVRLISDGRYRNRGPMSGGIVVDLQKSAVVLVDDIEVIVTTQVTQPYDVEIFHAHGIDPARKNILLLKSTNHFKAAFGPLAKRVLNVSVPGLLAQDPRSVSYINCRRPIYPLDDL